MRIFCVSKPVMRTIKRITQTWLLCQIVSWLKFNHISPPFATSAVKNIGWNTAMNSPDVSSVCSVSNHLTTARPSCRTPRLLNLAPTALKEGCGYGVVDTTKITNWHQIAATDPAVLYSRPLQHHLKGQGVLWDHIMENEFENLSDRGGHSGH